MRLFTRRVGISNVFSTIILTAVLLSVIITATYLSNDILNAQMVESEFETSKNLITSIDSEIEDLLFKPGSSSVIQASFTNILPGYNKSGEELNIIIEEDSQIRLNETIPMNTLTFTGRRTIGGVYDYNLQGGAYLLSPMSNSSIGRIKISKPDKLQVTLDYNRVQYSLTGKIFLISNQTGEYTLHNTLEVICVELDFGEFSSSDSSVIMIQNQIREEPISLDLSGDFTIAIETSNGSESVLLSDIGGDPSIPTILNLYPISIEISVIGG